MRTLPLCPFLRSGLLDTTRYEGLELIDPSPHDDALAAAALAAASTCYAPYSGCPSGIAVRTRRGDIFAGGYLESAAYNPSLPPLQAALIAAVIQGGVAWSDLTEVTLVELGGEEEHVPVQQEIGRAHV